MADKFSTHSPHIVRTSQKRFFEKVVDGLWLQSLFCINERLYIPLQHLIDIPLLMLGAMIFHELIWMQDVRADLTSPFDLSAWPRQTCHAIPRPVQPHAVHRASHGVIRVPFRDFALGCVQR